MKKENTSYNYYRESFTFEGKRYDIRGKTRRELRRKVEEKLRALESGEDTTGGNMPVSKWFEKYLEVYKKPSVGERTYKDLQGRVHNYINPEIGNRRLKDIKPVDLQKIMNSAAGKSKSFVDKLRDLIKGAFKQARIDRILAYDPAEAIVEPKANDGIGRPITEDERQHILNVCRTHKHGFWVLFMMYTGARPVETRLAKWEDVDLDNNRITIHSAKNNFGDRLVPINPELLPYLTCGGGYIFPQDDDQTQATRGSLRSWWKGFKRAVDIDMGAQVSVRGGVIPATSKVAPDLVPYCLRHTCATDWYTAGVPINTIREFMGHNDISTTTRVYVKLSDEAFNDAAARIAAFEQGKKEHKILIIPREQEMTS